MISTARDEVPVSGGVKKMLGAKSPCGEIALSWSEMLASIVPAAC